MGKKVNANKVRQEVAHRYTERIKELEAENREWKEKYLETKSELEKYKKLDSEYTKIRFFLSLPSDKIKGILESIRLEDTLGGSFVRPLFESIIKTGMFPINTDYREIWKDIFGE
jgi:hypothetical protein